MAIIAALAILAFLFVITGPLFFVILIVSWAAAVWAEDRDDDRRTDGRTE
jgi:hypothetical protein